MIPLMRSRRDLSLIPRVFSPLELGNVISNKELQRSSEDEITVADLTGVAVQDIRITKAVYKTLVS